MAYNEELKEEILKQFFYEDKDIKYLSQKYNIPRGTLYTWATVYKEKHDIKDEEIPNRKRLYYKTDFKIKCVKKAIKSGNVRAVAKEMEVSYTSLLKWCEELQSEANRNIDKKKNDIDKMNKVIPFYAGSSSVMYKYRNGGNR